jgi:hypothetical protein
MHDDFFLPAVTAPTCGIGSKKRHGEGCGTARSQLRKIPVWAQLEVTTEQSGQSLCSSLIVLRYKLLGFGVPSANHVNRRPKAPSQSGMVIKRVGKASTTTKAEPKHPSTQATLQPGNTRPHQQRTFFHLLHHRPPNPLFTPSESVRAGQHPRHPRSLSLSLPLFSFLFFCSIRIFRGECRREAPPTTSQRTA